MDALSSSFLQNCTLTPLTPSSPLLQFKISSVITDEKYELLTREKPTSPTIRKRNLNPIKGTTFHTPKQPSTHHEEGKTGQTRRRETKSLISNVFNSLDNFICTFMDPPLRPSIDPKHVLSGNFAPVDELPPTACEVVEGSLPSCLDGAFIRNGPNPQFFPRGPYHLFDGDGMLHSIRILNGRAKFCSRFIKTYKYRVEKESGSPVIPNVFSAFNGLYATLARCALIVGRMVAGQYHPRHGIGNANTSLALFSGKLFALAESDLPYSVKLTSDGDIITLGRHESFGEPFTTMTAHPKVDAQTKEVFAFRQSITFNSPFLIYFKINSNGIKQPEVPIFSLPEPTLIHDFAISEKYAIFPDIQVVIKPENILKGMPAVSVDTKKIPRLGIIPRNAKDESEMLWIDVPGFNIVHAVNAWDEDGGETIVMVAPNVTSVEHVLNRLDLVHSSLERIEINVKEKIVKRWPLSPAILDFGVINPAYVGKKNRYVYAAVGAPMPKIAGVVKIDLSLSTADSGDCTVGKRMYGPNCYAGETIFVAREPDNPTAEEDDGYLMTYVHNEDSEESKFIVMDAKSPSLEIVASVKLPRRVPYGFHGIFVSETDLKKL